MAGDMTQRCVREIASVYRIEKLIVVMAKLVIGSVSVK
jgi:hypothetical protein